jgi:FixJ family two-component response regulator
VIVVEDDPSMNQAMTRILRLAGLLPVAFTSAEGFLESGKGEGAMCLIIDVQLPGMNGFALQERLSGAGAVPPVIFITAFDEPEARAQAAAHRASAFLAKPFSGQTLVETVRRVASVR